MSGTCKPSRSQVDQGERRKGKAARSNKNACKSRFWSPLPPVATGIQGKGPADDEEQ